MTVIDIKLTHQICVPDDEAAIAIIVGEFAQPMRWSIAGPALTLTAATGTATSLEWRQTPDGTPATEPSTP